MRHPVDYKRSPVAKEEMLAFVGQSRHHSIHYLHLLSLGSVDVNQEAIAVGKGPRLRKLFIRLI